MRFLLTIDAQLRGGVCLPDETGEPIPTRLSVISGLQGVVARPLLQAQ
jgi:hypothetical protein